MVGWLEDGVKFLDGMGRRWEAIVAVDISLVVGKTCRMLLIYCRWSGDGVKVLDGIGRRLRL